MIVLVDDIYKGMYRFIKKYSNYYIAMLRRFCDDESYFHREFGCPYKEVSESVYHLYNQIIKYNTGFKNDVYISVYRFRELLGSFNSDEILQGRSRKCACDPNTAIINKVYFDLDTHKGEVKVCEMEQVFEDTMSFFDRFDKKNIRILFTTRKGFHVYIKLDKLIDKKELIRLQNEWGKGLVSMDRGFVGDTSRIFRIPFTIYHKTKLMIVPVLKHDTLDRVISRSSRVPRVGELNMITSW